MLVRRFWYIALLFLLVSFNAGSSGQTTAKKTHSTKSKKGPAAAKKKSAQAVRKLGHIRRAFVASADLRPMAQQLLENRTPQAYEGVEAYARKHAKDDAGPLAWLVLGYAHYLDRDYTRAQSCWEHSTPLEPVLGDYLIFMQARSHADAKDFAAVLQELNGFDEKYPDSLLAHDVALVYAGALMGSNEPQKAAAYLEKHRQPVKSDIEFALGQADAAAGEKGKAAEIFRRIYFEMPTSAEADGAAQQLRLLGEAAPTGSFEQRHTRVTLLARSRHFQEVVTELSPLLEQAPPEKMLDLQAEFGSALYKARKRDEAQHLFESIAQNQAASVDARAQSLYFLAELARDKDDGQKHREYVAQLRSLAPDSPWMQEALMSAGNMYMLRRDYETAVPFYAEIYQRQKNGRYSPYTHWRAAWLTYLMGKRDDAKKLFEEQLEMYPSSAEVPAAIYWRGRLAEDDGDKALARAYYQKLTENYRYFYYSILARERMARLGEQAGDPPLLDKLPRPPAPPQEWEPPADNERAQKAKLLANAALYDFAVAEMQAASPGTPPWEAKSVAEIYSEQGSYIHAIESLKRALPGYFSAEIPQIPRKVWETLFPRPFWDELKKDSAANRLDPHLVASLIRQESEFNPAAISPANAYGLMQLLPSVGKGMAHELKIRHFSTDELLVANTNLQLGTRYFRHMMDHFDGRVEYALAAYNAGEDRVDDWRKNGKYADMEEFVESIPFQQTRDYVQAIVRNAALYKLLYSN
ncbi:MAG TPA: transglycosylase SLT domain-containing protein [Candidatus Angelobacter sp.]|nr:transglycosylase SLT domain-containing protein [Candidatus Angelobacter sp.]